MPPKKSPRRRRRGLSGSFLLMGLISLFYSGLFPLFRLLDYAAMGAAMWLGGKLLRSFIQKHFEGEDKAQEEQAEMQRREEEEKRREAQSISSTGDKQVDELLLRGQQMLYQIRSENERLPDPVISGQIDEIESISNQIFRIVIEQPEKADQIRRFMEYYLPTTLKMLSAYRRMEENGASGEQARKTQERIRQSLDTVIAAFKKQLNQLFEEEAIDIATDIDVLETMLRQDGLIDSGLKVKTSTGEEK